MKLIKLLAVALFAVSCSTTTSFKIPKGHDLIVDHNKVEEGKYSKKPMFWNRAGGIPYRLEKNGEVVEQGKLGAKFRVTSIFWPPFALIYWPMGFDRSGYDLTKPNNKVRVNKTMRKK